MRIFICQKVVLKLYFFITTKNEIKKWKIKVSHIFSSPDYDAVILRADKPVKKISAIKYCPPEIFIVLKISAWILISSRKKKNMQSRIYHRKKNIKNYESAGYNEMLMELHWNLPSVTWLSFFDLRRQHQRW